MALLSKSQESHNSDDLQIMDESGELGSFENGGHDFMSSSAESFGQESNFKEFLLNQVMKQKRTAYEPIAS